MFWNQPKYFSFLNTARILLSVFSLQMPCNLCAIVSIRKRISIPPCLRLYFLFSKWVNDTSCGMSLTDRSLSIRAPELCEGVSGSLQLYLIQTNEQHHKSDGLLSSHCAGLSVIKEQDLEDGLSFVHIRLLVPWSLGVTSNSIVNITQVLPFCGPWNMINTVLLSLYQAQGLFCH